jgi:hypothetical protein
MFLEKATVGMVIKAGVSDAARMEALGKSLSRI